MRYIYSQIYTNQYYFTHTYLSRSSRWYASDGDRTDSQRTRRYPSAISVLLHKHMHTVTYSVVVWSHTSMSPLKFDDCTAALQELGQNKASTSGATFCHCFESCRDMVGGITQFYQINQNTKSLNPY